MTVDSVMTAILPPPPPLSPPPPQQQQQQQQQEPLQQQRPNIMLLVTDDQDLLLGGTEHMPFFDQHLTQQGTTFENFFVHTPICCPSRASILTGQYLHNNGVFNNTGKGNCDGTKWQEEGEIQTFAIYAQQAGYRTAFVGKYLNMYGATADEEFRVPPGWNQWFAVGESAYYDYTVVRSDDGFTAERIFHGSDYAIDYFPDLVANHTIRTIQTYTTSTAATDDASTTATTLITPPFLIVVSWPTPHGPFTPAPWAEHLFNDTFAPRTPNWNASDEFMQQKHWIMRQQSPIDVLSERNIDESYQKRLQSLQSVDRHIDQFIRTLTEQKVLDNTIIMYTSDNGFQSGQHRLGGDKRHLYEHDIRVPFVIRGPNIPKNTTNHHQVVGNIDIAPTIYHIIHNYDSQPTTNATTPLPDTMDGISILPIISHHHADSSSSSRQDMLISYFGEGYRPCHLMVCPPDPSDDFHIIDGTNNTYHCIRSVVPNITDETTGTGKNFTYCRFDDDENFGEYYDHTTDPWQLENKFLQLSTNEQAALDDRLTQLRTCRGSGCRLPTPALTLFLDQQVGSSSGPTLAPFPAGPTVPPSPEPFHNGSTVPPSSEPTTSVNPLIVVRSNTSTFAASTQARQVSSSPRHRTAQVAFWLLSLVQLLVFNFVVVLT